MTPTEQGITVFIGVVIITVAWFLAARAIRSSQQRKAQRDAEWLDRETAAGRREAEWFDREVERRRQHFRDMEELRQSLAAARRNRAAARRNRAAVGGMRRRIARRTSIGVHMRNKNRRLHRAKDIPFVIRPQHPNEAIERAFAEGIRSSSSQGRMVTPDRSTVTHLAAQQQRRDWDRETWHALQHDLFAEAVHSPRWLALLAQFEHMQANMAKGGAT